MRPGHDRQSEEKDLLYQKKPLFSRESIYPAKSWTETVEGYINNAKELTQCILRNRRLMRRPYSWLVTINFEDELEAAEVAALWTKVARKLREKGVVALWVREPSRTNRVHHHLLLRNSIDRKGLERVVEASMPPREVVRWHKNLKSLSTGWWVAFYLTKAKVSGVVRGRFLADRYAGKRLLFRPNIKLQKYGTIGAFWAKPKKNLWKEIADGERRIKEAIVRPEIRLLVNHLHDLLGDPVSITRIERTIGLHAEAPAVRRWSERLALDDDNDNIYTIE